MKINVWKLIVRFVPTVKAIVEAIGKKSEGGRKITKAEAAEIKAEAHAALDDLLDDSFQEAGGLAD